MTTLAPTRQVLRLTDVDWPTYSRLLRTFARRPAVRLAYDRGELELMAPQLEHDDDSALLADLVFILTEELGLPLKRGGSTTLRRRRKSRGIEPDACFWIASAAQLAGRRRLDLRRDPPPDLAIEVDVTHSSLDRFGIYAALGVPELWRLDGNTLTFYRLGDDGQYAVVLASVAIPAVTPTELLAVLTEARAAGDENAVLRRYRADVRSRRAAPPP